MLELLKQPNSEDDSRKKILKQTMPPILATIASDIDLDASKIDSLLSHSPPKYVYVTMYVAYVLELKRIVNLLSGYPDPTSLRIVTSVSIYI